MEVRALLRQSFSGLNLIITALSRGNVESNERSEFQSEG